MEVVVGLLAMWAFYFQDFEFMIDILMPAEDGSCSTGVLAKMASSRLSWLEGRYRKQTHVSTTTTTTFSSVVVRHAKYASMTKKTLKQKRHARRLCNARLEPLYHENGTALDGHR